MPRAKVGFLQARSFAQELAQVIGSNPHVRNINFDWYEPA